MTSEGRGLTIGSRGITKNSVSCIERFVGPSAHRAPRPRSAPQPPRSGFVRSQGPPLQPPVSGSDRLTSASRSAASTSDAAPAAMHRNSRAPAGAQSTRVNAPAPRSANPHRLARAPPRSRPRTPVRSVRPRFRRRQRSLRRRSLLRLRLRRNRKHLPHLVSALRRPDVR